MIYLSRANIDCWGRLDLLERVTIARVELGCYVAMVVDGESWYLWPDGQWRTCAMYRNVTEPSAYYRDMPSAFQAMLAAARDALDGKRPDSPPDIAED